MLEVLQAKSERHLNKLECNHRMIPDLQIPWIYILLEMDLQPLTDSCHWSETSRRIVAADRRPLQVVYGNLLESRRQLSDHRTMFMLLVCDQCTILGTKNICDHWRSAATIVWWLYIGLRHIKDNPRSPKTSTIVARSQGGLNLSYSVWLGSK